MSSLVERTVRAAVVAAVVLTGIEVLPHSIATASLFNSHSAATFTAQRAPDAAATARDVTLASLPAATAAQITPHVTVPYLTPWSQAKYAQLKAAARTTLLPPATGLPAAPAIGAALSNGSEYTPSTSRSFAGLDENRQGSVSGAGGLTPSDGGIACSPAYCLEAINSAIGVYNSSGTLQSGYPKSLRAFDGATCSNGGNAVPFDTDAAYDGAHFIVISETTGGVDGCSEKSGFYLAISTTNNPLTATWHVYHFDLSQGGTVFCDFPKMGYNAAAVYFACNNYGSSGFTNARVLGCKKATLVTGASISCPGFFVNQFAVQPAKTLDNGNFAPVANTELFVSSNNGGGSGLNVSTFRNAASGTPAFDAVSLATNGYSIPPAADNNQNNGGCAACIDTGDNRVGSDVYYRYGHLYVAFNSALNNGTGIEPAFYWADTAIVLDDTGKIQGGSSVVRQGTFAYTTSGTYYPALMIDSAGNMLITYDYSGASKGPAMALNGLRATSAGGPGGLHDGGIFVAGGGTVPGASSSNPSRWGDYNTASYDGTNSWFEAEIGTSSESWATQIARANYTPTIP